MHLHGIEKEKEEEEGGSKAESVRRHFEKDEQEALCHSVEHPPHKGLRAHLNPVAITLHYR